jgi:hypothetical protein
VPLLNKEGLVVPRLSDWPERLYEFIEQRRHVQFTWGSNDCCTFAADAVLACTSVDPIADLIAENNGPWTSQLQAQRLLVQHGGMKAIVTARFGTPVPVSMAQRGDVLMINSADNPALVICVGTQYVGPGPDGLVCGDVSSADLAWRV